MLIALSLAGVLFAGAAASQTAAPSPAAPAAAADAAKPVQPKKPKKVCTDVAPLGSLMTKTVCRTPEEVEAEERKAHRVTDALSDRGAFCNGAAC
jgi:hypothetical protein